MDKQKILDNIIKYNTNVDELKNIFYDKTINTITDLIELYNDIKRIEFLNLEILIQMRTLEGMPYSTLPEVLDHKMAIISQLHMAINIASQTIISESSDKYMDKFFADLFKIDDSPSDNTMKETHRNVLVSRYAFLLKRCILIQLPGYAIITDIFKSKGENIIKAIENIGKINSSHIYN